MTSSTRQVLHGVRVLSLALNLPGPAALMRCHQMGAHCVKIEPLGGDPMQQYSATAYASLHAGIAVLQANLKTELGQQLLHTELSQADVLLTSFRPSAIRKLGLDRGVLQPRYPALSHVAIVGSPAELAEEPGHDLTYLANSGLVPGLELPATLYADMSGSLMASEAILQALLHQRVHGQSVLLEVALSSAASYMALPKVWGLTEHNGIVGGAHAGYQVYRCLDGRVAVAALEPHFAAALCRVAGLVQPSSQTMLEPATRQAIAQFMRSQTCQQLTQLAQTHDIPLHTLA